MSVLSRTVPIHLKLPTVKINPLEEEALGSIGKLADDFSRRNVDDDFGPLASGVDVWGIVLEVMHEHHNTVEATDDGHFGDDGVEGPHHHREALGALPGLEETSRSCLPVERVRGSGFLHKLRIIYIMLTYLLPRGP